MFENLKTPQDYINFATNYFAGYPQTPEEIQEALKKVNKAMEAEAEKFKYVVSVYNKASRGDASMNEITIANKKAQALLVTARFLAMVGNPVGITLLPLLIKMAEEFDVEFIPESISKEFSN